MIFSLFVMAERRKIAIPARNGKVLPRVGSSASFLFGG
jgi:hypothetical protein